MEDRTGTPEQGSRYTNCVQGLGGSCPKALPGQGARQCGMVGPPTCPASVVLHPAILRDERIDDLFHGQVGDELFLGQRAPGHRVKVAHTLQ